MVVKHILSIQREIPLQIMKCVIMSPISVLLCWIQHAVGHTEATDVSPWKVKRGINLEIFLPLEESLLFKLFRMLQSSLFSNNSSLRSALPLFPSEDVSTVLEDLYPCNNPCFQAIFIDYFLGKSSSFISSEPIAESLSIL